MGHGRKGKREVTEKDVKVGNGKGKQRMGGSMNRA